MFHNKRAFVKEFRRKISSMFGKSLEEATQWDAYTALASMIRDTMYQRWAATNTKYLDQNGRQVYYFSLEFLMGKMLGRNLLYLDVDKVCREGLAELGLDLQELIDAEPDAGLGNGGLGRLAACFLDSIASLGLPGHGCGIRYKYGLFAQKIIDGYQVELPDNWLRETNAWEVRKPDKSVVVRLGGYVRTEVDDKGDAHFIHEDFTPVLAVPYDMPLPGYRNQTVNTLRLWSAEAVDQYFDFASFSRGDYISAVSHRYSVEAISEVLYPDDSNYQNRLLRLKQQYFFVSAGLQSIVRRYKKTGSDLADLARHVVIQINDTHPALAIPELMRILLDEEGFSWDDAWAVTTKIIAYTNHTIMPEALEKWPVDSFRELLPRIYMIIEEINRRLCADLLALYPSDQDRVTRMSIIHDGQIHMAHLAITGSFSVNGVAAVHSELLKNTVLKDFYQIWPEKFNNKTNGITHRRWLMASNPDLAALISSAIGDGWIHEPIRLRELIRHKEDRALKDGLARVKHANKERLTDYIQRQTGIAVDPSAIFDVQVKRIHAYKRQLLNALHILHLYNTLRENPDYDMHPRVFILAGKAAPSYYYAKNVIKLINELGTVINADKRVGDKLKVVFLENYGITLAQQIFPAAEISEQISTASKEASGTSNMKFMLNGAITLGTADGANIEIRERVGDDNFILFGLSVEEVLAYYHQGGYHSAEFLRNHALLSGLLNQLSDGSLFPHLPRDEFANITRALVDYNDEFFVLRDFDAYAQAHKRADAAYRDRDRWLTMSLCNTAMAGIFSSDHTIAQYAKDIWKI